MKNIILFSFVLLLLISCAKEVTAPAPDQKKNLTTTELMKEQIKNGDFRYDFIGYVENHQPADRETMRHILALNKRLPLKDKWTNAEENYQVLKAELIKWQNEDVKEEYSRHTQNFALRCLRNYFLNIKNPDSSTEVIFLLNLLIEHNNNDLDVLVDAFMYVEKDLIPSERKRYIDHIKDWHTKHKNTVEEKFENYRTVFETSENEQQKLGYLMAIKRLECLSRSINYTEETITFAGKLD
ncbi:MAG: hypothetical protein AAFZ15_13065 [Bacteroidota bacterium]